RRRGHKGGLREEYVELRETFRRAAHLARARRIALRPTCQAGFRRAPNPRWRRGRETFFNPHRRGRAPHTRGRAPSAADERRVLARFATGATPGSPTDNRVEPRPIDPMIALVLRISTARPVSWHLGAQGGKSQCRGQPLFRTLKNAA